MNVTVTMKSSLVTVVALFFLSGCAWNLAGNAGTDPGSNFLGTTDNKPLIVKTNNNEAARIDAAGNVGIGTTSPSEKLTVAGRVESTAGGVKFPDGSVQTTAATIRSLTATTRFSTATVGPTTCCRTASVSCNADETATGGGFSRSDDPKLEVFYSKPVGNGWSVSMTNYGSASRSVTAYVVCLKLQ